jgi:serine/threonine protein kinase
MPIILLTIAGNRLAVSTAVFTDKIYADELLSIALLLGSHKSYNVFRLARVFMAITESMDLLRDLYKNLQAPSHPPLQTIPLWPTPTVDPPEPVSKSIPELEYFAKVNRVNGKPLLRIDEENERHAMYLAQMQIKTSTESEETKPTQVFVKFTPDYNEVAHRLLADHNPPLAPALHFCERVIGDMYMVIMEYIPESKGGSICSENIDAHFPFPKDLPRIVERDVSKALSLLHGQGIAFGDLRGPNLLCLSGEDRVMLVDFDDVGLDGKGRFSACLNPEAGLCASAQRGQIMKKESDMENLERFLGELRRSFPENESDKKSEGQGSSESDLLAVDT